MSVGTRSRTLAPKGMCRSDMYHIHIPCSVPRTLHMRSNIILHVCLLPNQVRPLNDRVWRGNDCPSWQSTSGEDTSIVTDSGVNSAQAMYTSPKGAQIWPRCSEGITQMRSKPRHDPSFSLLANGMCVQAGSAFVLAVSCTLPPYRIRPVLGRETSEMGFLPLRLCTCAGQRQDGRPEG